MIDIRNDQECFVQLWRQLERTRQLFGQQYRRFCIRHVLESWMGAEATDTFIWEVCARALIDDQQLYGLDLLPPPMVQPRASRAFLHALVAVKLHIGPRKVNLSALDRAYSIAFPHSKPLNINKVRRQHLREKTCSEAAEAGQPTARAQPKSTRSEGIRR